MTNPGHSKIPKIQIQKNHYFIDVQKKNLMFLLKTKKIDYFYLMQRSGAVNKKTASLYFSYLRIIFSVLN